MYDGLTVDEVDAFLDSFKVYNGLSHNILKRQFLNERTLSRYLAPIATFDDPSLVEDEKEYVAMVEGVLQPVFGLAFSIDKVQFDFNVLTKDSREAETYSKSAIKHAQRLSNFFVDEARLSRNYFTYREDESKSLITNHDIVLLDIVEKNQEIRKVEYYLFKWNFIKTKNNYFI